MNSQEKTLARILFRNKIHSVNGQKFEDIFTMIMNYMESDFQQIKPWGNIGDRKSDGSIKSKGIYFQVFAPEEIGKSYVDVVNKIETDFKGLLENWSPVKEFYFVVNDKYLGVNADCEKKIQKIKSDNRLDRAGFLTTKDLENSLFELSDDQILSVIGFLPDPEKLKTLDYSILNEIIEYIMQVPLTVDVEENIIAPDWDEKIKFNSLSKLTANYLTNGYLQIGVLEKYLKNNGKFISSELQKRLYHAYIAEKEKGLIGDNLFWSIVNEACPSDKALYQASVIVLMAKYFESCDIFEEPTSSDKK